MHRRLGQHRHEGQLHDQGEQINAHLHVREERRELRRVVAARVAFEGEIADRERDRRGHEQQEKQPDVALLRDRLGAAQGLFALEARLLPWRTTR